MSVRSGYSADTKKHLLLGAGCFYKNFQPGTDTEATASAKLIGATQGGGEFAAIPTIHDIAIDGVQGKVKDLSILDSWDVSLTANFIELSEAVIQLALGASTKTTESTVTSYSVIKGDSAIESADYLDNITYIGTISGSDKPVMIQVMNAMAKGGLNIKTEDTKEGTVSVKFEGHYDGTAPGVAPFKIYYPTIA